MTKPVTRKLAVDCLLDRVIRQFGTPLVTVAGEELLPGMDIQFDHIHADTFGGAHEYQNLRPLPRLTHQKKTAQDIKDKAKIDRITGVTCNGPKKKIPQRKTETLREMAERRVIAVRGSSDVPGFELCVEAEMKNLRQKTPSRPFQKRKAA